MAVQTSNVDGTCHQIDLQASLLQQILFDSPALTNCLCTFSCHRCCLQQQAQQLFGTLIGPI